ncbi:MAG: ATP-binding protein [Bacteroidota bacterium]
MPNTLPPLIRYFRACYQADFRATRLRSFVSKKASLPFLFADEAFLADQLSTLPVPTDWGQAMSSHLFLHAKEEQLFCHAFFLLGRTQVLGRRKEVCAPLFLIPAEIIDEAEVYQIKLDFGGTLINPAFAEALQGTEVVHPEIGNLFQFLNEELPLPPFDFDALHQIETALKTCLPGLSHPDYHSFPVANELEVLSQAVRKQKEGFSIWPNCGLATLEKSAGAMGILNELEILSEQKSFSPVVEALFADGTSKRTNKPDPEIAPLPVLLSASQEAILKTAATQTISMVNGPPGTGKSFTIAAIAADRLSAGETVLIAAKNEQAVNVIADKLSRDFELPDIAIRANRSDYRRHLRRRIKDWLDGLGLTYIYPYQMQRYQTDLESRRSQVSQIEDRVERRIMQDLDKQELLTKERPNLWQRWQKWRLQKQVLQEFPIWKDMQALDSRRGQLEQAGRTYLESLFHRRLNKAFQANRAELQTVWKALRSQTGKEKERFFQQINFPKLIEALPVWLVDTAHVHEVLPLQEALFDLVIIDEASQCDIASALPLLQRAKRAVIVGDPKQLRHVSFLSRSRQAVLADQFKLPSKFRKDIGTTLSYRDSSLLDLVSTRIQRQNHVIMLDEHFRSLPDLIRFSNQEFYRSQLKIMTANPGSGEERNIYIHRTNGVRHEKGYNAREVAAILRRVEEVVQAEAELAIGLCQSIGILSPFRSQVEQLKKAFKMAFTAEQMARHRMLIGTAHSFQGEERDIMCLSWVVDPNTPAGVLRYFQREDVFNVSITRARVAQYLFVSVGLEHIPNDSLLARYLIDAGIRQTEKPTNLPQIWNDPFLEEVRLFIEAQGVETVFENYHIAGLEIDLVFVHDGRTYCIDLIGYPGPYEAAIPSNRWKMLSRLHLHPFSLPYSHWLFRREESEAALRQFIGEEVKVN